MPKEKKNNKKEERKIHNPQVLATQDESEKEKILKNAHLRTTVAKNLISSDEKLAKFSVNGTSYSLTNVIKAEIFDDVLKEILKTLNFTITDQQFRSEGAALMKVNSSIKDAQTLQTLYHSYFLKNYCSDSDFRKIIQSATHFVLKELQNNKEFVDKLEALNEFYDEYVTEEKVFKRVEVKPEKINIDRNVSDDEEEPEKPTSKLMPQSRKSNWGRRIEESPYSKYQNEKQYSNKRCESAKREGSVRSSSSIKVGGMKFIENRDGKGKKTERSFSIKSSDGSVKSIKGERHPNLKEISKRLKNATMEHGNQDEKRRQNLNKSGIFTSKETDRSKDSKYSGKGF